MPPLLLSRAAFAAAITLLTAAAWSAPPRPIGTIYDVDIYGITLRDGQQVEVPLKARAHIVEGPAPDGGTNNPKGPALTTATVDLDIPSTVVLVKIPRENLPATVAELFGAARELTYAPRGYPPHGQTQINLAAGPPVTEQGRKQTHFDGVVYDGAGHPAAGMQIDISAPVRHGTADVKVNIVSQTLGPDGRLAFSVPRTLTGSAVGEFDSPFDGSATHCDIIATDPSLGQTQRLSFPPPPRVFLKPVPFTDRIDLALVSATASDPAFRGRVVRQDQTPVAGAVLRGEWVDLPGRGGTQLFGEINITAGPDGRFSISVPASVLQTTLGNSVLPAPSTLRVVAENVATVALQTTHENLITLPYTEDLVFELHDEHDQPYKNIKQFLNRVTLSLVEQPETSSTAEIPNLSVGPIVDETKAQIKAPHIPLPATASLEGSNFKFETQRLEKGAGAPGNIVVWRLNPAHAVMTGSAFAAETSEPLSGAIVAGNSADDSSAYTIEDLTAAQFEELYANWSAPEPGTNTGVPGYRTPSGRFLSRPEAVARTASDGSFTLNFAPGQRLGGVYVFAPGRIAAHGNLYPMQLHGVDLSTAHLSLPGAALPLAASATVIVNAPPTIPNAFLKDLPTSPATVGIDFSVGFDWNSSWKGPVGEAYPSTFPWTPTVGTEYGRFDSPMSLHVPAGVKFTVAARAPGTPPLDRAVWSNVGPVAPGMSLNLGAKTMTLKRPFLVIVKHADGTPAAGMAVRIDSDLPLSTDADGIVTGWTSGHVGRIQVLPTLGWQFAAQKEDIDIPDTPTPTQIEITLPAQ